MNLQEGNSEF